MKLATLFSGGEGVGVGARDTGLCHLWGIEMDDDVAQVARDNGFVVHTADVTEVDPTDFEPPDVLHASPPCLNFSVARFGRQEDDRDVARAEAMSRFIKVLRPHVFTLENVWGYRKSRSWAIVSDALHQGGYWFDLAHVNAADFGVPQTRRRMVVRAVLGGLVPPLPPPEPHIGWYAAIADIVAMLPDSRLAPWQQAGLSAEASTIMLLVDSAGYLDGRGKRVPVTRRAGEPANTVIANHGRRPMRALLVGGQFAEPSNGGGLRPPQAAAATRPAFTVTAHNRGDWRAVLPARVVQMTPRCLARFQSFPDSYILPGNKTLACRVIGNAVPPLLYRSIVASMVASLGLA